MVQKAIIGCKNLKEINVSLQNKFYTEVDGVLFDKNMETLLVYPGANENEEYIVPDGIRRIDKVAFAGCSNLKKNNIARNFGRYWNWSF